MTDLEGGDKPSALKFAPELSSRFFRVIPEAELNPWRFRVGSSKLGTATAGQQIRSWVVIKLIGITGKIVLPQRAAQGL